MDKKIAKLSDDDFKLIMIEKLNRINEEVRLLSARLNEINWEIQREHSSLSNSLSSFKSQVWGGAAVIVAIVGIFKNHLF